MSLHKHRSLDNPVVTLCYGGKFVVLYGNLGAPAESGYPLRTVGGRGGVGGGGVEGGWVVFRILHVYVYVCVCGGRYGSI